MVHGSLMPLAAPIMCPDSLLGLYKYLLLTYLWTVMYRATAENSLVFVRWRPTGSVVFNGCCVVKSCARNRSIAFTVWLPS